MVKDKAGTLIKLVTLLSRELTLYKDSEIKDYSTDLAETILDVFKKETKPLLGGETAIIDGLLNLLENMVNNLADYEIATLCDQISLILKDNKAMKDTVISNISKEMKESGLKASIINMRNQLNNYYREVQMKKKISKANFDILSNSIKGNFNEYMASLILNLETLNAKVSSKTPGIVSEIDLDDGSLETILTAVKDLSDGNGKMVTGFAEVNTILQGGFRRGEMCMINALPHNYKSGLCQSLFMQGPRHNVPVMVDKTKKPLCVYISFEDDAEVFTKFMYTYLYHEEHEKLPDLKEVEPSEMRAYMRERLRINGYHVKMLRINPSDWSYKDMFNYILKLEAEGYEIHQCLIDYLTKLPPVGCIGSGGVEYRDLYDRTRQFFSPKKITIITPHQLSTEAKQLIRNGVNKLQLVKEVAEKGYTELSKQLDQVVDIEICIGIASLNKKPVLTLQRGKHRGAGIMDDKDKYQILNFPHKAPIMPNLHKIKEAIDGDNDDVDNLFG